MRPVIGMKEVDHSILEVLDRSNLPIQAGTVMWYINNRNEFPDTSRTTFYRRLNHLEYADLVEVEDDRFYKITDLGERLLKGDLSDGESAEVSYRLQEGPPDDD